MSYLLNKKNRTQCGNPLIWGIVIFIIILFSVFFIIPSTQKWLTLRSETKLLRNSNIEDEDQILRKNEQLSSIKKDFNLIAKNYLKDELLLFPKNLNTNNVAKILELYSLQYSLIDSKSQFTLNSVSFSKQESENFVKNSANISVSSTEESLKDFIYFIQNNKLPQKLINAQKSSNPFLRGEIPTKNFLDKNKLPIANIESISSVKEDDNESLLLTNIKINFFSQKTDNEQD